MEITTYVTFDSPVPYKGLKIYPILVKDYLYFNLYAQCFSLDKNSIPNMKIISMTNLEYIYYLAESEEKNASYLVYFDRLLSMCIKNDDSFDDLNKSVERYGYSEKRKPIFKIGEEIYDSKDFEALKEIICEQNLFELPDENISKEVRDSLEKAKEYKDKISGTKSGTLEDYIISVSGITGWSFDYIYNMPVRKFVKAIRRFDNLIHYKIYLSASMSGMVEFKDKSFIKHWLTNLDESQKYGDVSMDLDTIQEKISLESAKQ